MSLRLITAPTEYPVTVTEAKLQCKVDGADYDSIMETNIAVATALVQKITGRAIMSQTWEQVLDDFSDAMMLPKGPVQSVTSVKYFDTAETEQTVSASDYTLDNVSDPAWVVKAEDATWPEVAEGVNNVIIRFVAGMDPDDDDFQLVRGAIILTVRSLLDDPTTAELPPRALDLLTNCRSFAF